jgi:hypothetical protein
MGMIPASDAVSRSLSDPESVAAGLGYVTQAVLQLASILDVPLRYPVVRSSRAYGPGSRVQGPGSRVQGPGSRVQGPGSRVQGPGSRVEARGSRV